MSMPAVMSSWGVHPVVKDTTRTPRVMGPAQPVETIEILTVTEVLISLNAVSASV